MSFPITLAKKERIKNLALFPLIFSPNGYLMEVYRAGDTIPFLGLGARDQGTRFPEFLFNPVFREINSLSISLGFPAGHQRAAVGTGDRRVTTLGAACAAPGLTLFYHSLSNPKKSTFNAFA